MTTNEEVLDEAIRSAINDIADLERMTFNLDNDTINSSMRIDIIRIKLSNANKALSEASAQVKTIVNEQFSRKHFQ